MTPSHFVKSLVQVHSDLLRVSLICSSKQIIVPALSILTMKKTLLSLLLLAGLRSVHAQTINVSLSTPASPFQDADVGAMAFGDVDNDGDQDLLISGKGGPVKTTLYINNGTGNFSEATGTPFVQVYGGHVGFADLNQDNFIDLLVTGITSGGTRTANLYVNNQNGTFSTKPSPITPSNNGDFAFEDIDNDNDKDLILSGLITNGKITKLYVNDGAANFSEVLTTPFEQLNGSSVEFIDVENDGDKDVIIAGQFNTAPFSTNVFSAKLYKNNGSGIFTMVNDSSLIGVSGGDISVADSDNDGDLDILTNGNSPQGPITKLFTNNGSGVFTEVAGTPFTGTNVGTAQFADFNNDGKKDVILLGAKTGIPSATGQIYENQGNNNFVVSAELIATYLGSLAIADIDNDGDLDFIMGGTHFQLPTHGPKLYVNNHITTGIQNLDNAGLVRYSPNPFHNQVAFQLNENFENLTIFDVLGQEVLHKAAPEKDFMLDMSRFSLGTYVAHFTKNQKSIKVKLVKF